MLASQEASDLVPTDRCTRARSARRSGAFAITCALLALASGAARASVITPAPANPVLRDCYRHEALTAAYSHKALTRALALMPPDVADYTACPAAITSQIAGLAGHRGKPQGGAVIKDFLKHHGLRFSYTRTTLKAALRQAPTDIEQYTYLLAAVRSQLVLRGR